MTIASLSRSYGCVDSICRSLGQYVLQQLRPFQRESFISGLLGGSSDWQSLSKSGRLTEAQIRRYADKLDWGRLSRYQSLSESLIRDFQDRVDWEHIASCQTLSEPFMVEFQDRLDWSVLSGCQILSESFMRRFGDRLDWAGISMVQRLSESFMEEFQAFLDWDAISASQSLSESFMRRWSDRLNWDWLSMFQSLSESFIRENADRLYWPFLCYAQPLSESLMREYADQLDWMQVSEAQSLSAEFVKEFVDRLDLEVYMAVRREKPRELKRREMRAYAARHGLRMEGDYLYAYRCHDYSGRRYQQVQRCYQGGRYYRDWHCDLRSEVEESFGLAIRATGNVPVRVHVDDWGVRLRHDRFGTCRVWGFEIVEQCEARVA